MVAGTAGKGRLVRWVHWYDSVVRARDRRSGWSNTGLGAETNAGLRGRRGHVVVHSVGIWIGWGDGRQLKSEVRIGRGAARG